MDEKIKEIEESLLLANENCYPIKNKVYCNDVQYLLSRIKELEEGIKKFKQQWDEEPDSYYQSFVDELFKLVEKEGK